MDLPDPKATYLRSTGSGNFVFVYPCREDHQYIEWEWKTGWSTWITSAFSLKSLNSKGRLWGANNTSVVLAVCSCVLRKCKFDTRYVPESSFLLRVSRRSTLNTRHAMVLRRTSPAVKMIAWYWSRTKCSRGITNSMAISQPSMKSIGLLWCLSACWISAMMRCVMKLTPRITVQFSSKLSE